MKICPNCGKPVYDSRSKYCSVRCRTDYGKKIENARERQATIDRRNKERTLLPLADFEAIRSNVSEPGYVIMLDAMPVEEGGFRPGRFFSATEMRRMLDVQSLTPGTLVRDTRDGQLLTVHYQYTKPGPLAGARAI